jgi:lysophospholipase L1-like esterase
MAPVEAEVRLCPQYTEGNASESNENRCQNCVRLIEYVNVLTTELKSAQLINTVLWHELNQIVNEYKATENRDTREKLKYQTKDYAGSDSEASNRNYRNPQVLRGRNIRQVKKNKQLDKSNLKASEGNEDRPIPKGCTDAPRTNLNSEYRVSGIVKPGARTKDILQTSIDQNMSKDDIVIICAGANDISKNNAKEGIRNIINFVKRTGHTNITIMEALHRHDLVDWSCVNKEIELFNRLLAKRLKLYKQVTVGRLHLDRQYFTRRGLHMNHEGKEKMCQQMAKLVKRKLRAENRASPDIIISLKYKEDTTQNHN